MLQMAIVCDPRSRSLLKFRSSLDLAPEPVALQWGDIDCDYIFVRPDGKGMFTYFERL